MLTYELHVGRLTEMRVAYPITDADQLGVRDQLMRIIPALGARQPVWCIDLRSGEVNDRESYGGFVDRMRRFPCERAAMLVGSSAIQRMQLQRMVREAGDPRYRVCLDEAEVIAWLGELLDADERTRLATFLEAGRSSVNARHP